MVEAGRRKSSALADARKSSLLTQDQLAERLGCSIMTISNWERNPSGMKLSNLAQWYHAMKPQGKAIIEQYVDDFLFA